MDALVLVLIVIAVVAIAAVAWIFWQRRQTQRLREGFGPEYERAVDSYGDRSKAERELHSRQRRIAALNIQPLSHERRDQFAEAWRSTQARFVDDPESAIADADRLIGEVMQARGYPVGDFEQRAADISVDHPQVVANYRSAHAIALRHMRGEASTEDLRQALVQYRALFVELLETDRVSPAAYEQSESRSERQEARR